VNILTAMSRTLQCCKCSKFLSNSLLYMLWRYNGKESINWLWFGSFCNVGLEYRLHYSWWTTHTTYCIHNMFKYTKSSEVTPQKNKQMKMALTFSHLWDSIPRGWWHMTRRSHYGFKRAQFWSISRYYCNLHLANEYIYSFLFILF